MNQAGNGVLLRDLINIPDEVHAGDFVLTLSKGVEEQSTISDYVVTPQLAGDFDEALGVIKSAVESGSSRAAYLDGSFGSGKSHFMAVLHAILRGDADARGKKGLADTVARHDPWLKGRTFLLIPFHLLTAQSLDTAILGGYVKYVLRKHPGTTLPAVYRDDRLLADARDERRRLGDDAFIDALPVTTGADEEWGASGWDTASLDHAFAEEPGGPERRRLVGDLLAGPFHRYVGTVSAKTESYVDFDEGLSIISQHAKEILGVDAIVLLLDELVLWLAGKISDHARIAEQVENVSKLTESEENSRPVPIISFVPRQRDLRELVSPAQAGNEVTSLFDMLKYGDGRFDHIALDDRNLSAIVSERLLKPKDAAAKAALDQAFDRARIGHEAWDVLLNTHGDRGTREDFRATYPFSPVFVRAMVDISGALQRERTALKLMQQLLVDYRDTLPVGQLMPLGAIFDVLTQGADRPFTDKLRDEFDQAKRFYAQRVRPFLLNRHGISEDDAVSAPPRKFRGDDLVVKTLLLAALVPNVPALNGLTATRLAALNHGSIGSMVPNQERRQVVAALRSLSGQFGEITLSGSEDDPRVGLALIGVDTQGIIDGNRKYDNPHARRRLVRDMLLKELGLRDQDMLETRAQVVWRGTLRDVDLVMGNVCDEADLPGARFQADPGTIRMILDYPFDETGRFPSDDAVRVGQLKEQLGDEKTLVWLPHFLSEERMADLSSLIIINHLLERDRLAEATPGLTAEDQHHARSQLESRRNALSSRLTDAITRAYGVKSPDPADLSEARAADSVLTLAHGLEPRLQIGQGIRGAFDRLCYALLDHCFPRHPDLSDPVTLGATVQLKELTLVLEAVDQASRHQKGRYEVPRASIPTVRKIANPLKIGEMHESVFLLVNEWPSIINRRTGAEPQATVGQIRGWINEEQPGLPTLIQNLIIACYAIQADKAWTRRERPIESPNVNSITDDMVLRGQELPSPEEFDRACARAEGIFRIPREPVRSARAVHSLAEKLRQHAAKTLQPLQSLRNEVRAHAATLGLDDTAPRMATSKSLLTVVAALAGPGDDTEILQLLAGADLPKDNAIYLAHLENTAGQLTALRDANWRVLDDFAAKVGTAPDMDPEADAILSVLRQNAVRDEHEVSLGRPLSRASDDALQLMMDRAQQSARAPEPSPGPAPDPHAGSITSTDPVREGADASSPPVTVRVRGRDGAACADRLRAALEAEPDAEFEVSWRNVNG